PRGLAAGVDVEVVADAARDVAAIGLEGPVARDVRQPADDDDRLVDTAARRWRWQDDSELPQTRFGGHGAKGSRNGRRGTGAARAAGGGPGLGDNVQGPGTGGRGSWKLETGNGKRETGIGNADAPRTPF